MADETSEAFNCDLHDNEKGDSLDFDDLHDLDDLYVGGNNHSVDTADVYGDEFARRIEALNCDTSLLNLNDDCLLELFSWLPLLDLCSIRTMCSRLRKLTDYYFVRMHKSLNFNDSDIKGDKCLAIKKEEILKILISFGQQIDELTLNRKHFSAQSDVLLPMLDAFCSQRCLQHLKLIEFTFNDDFIMNRYHPFANVERLTLENCDGDDGTFDELIKKCLGLSHLELIRYNFMDGKFLKQTYPMLQGFTLKSGSIPYSSELVEIFLTKNIQLKALNISECNVWDDDIFRTIADHLNDLETLTFRSESVTSNSNHTANLMRLLELQKLRVLEVVCNGNAIVDFLNGLAIRNQLESLGLACINMSDDFCNAIGRLKNLQNLKLAQIFESKESAPITSIAAQLPNLKQFHVASSDSVTFEHIIDFIENAPKLENLLLSSCKNIISFDETEFNRLAETCAKRDDELKLTIHIDDFEAVKRQINGKIRQSHSKNVHLVEISPDMEHKVPTNYSDED